MPPPAATTTTSPVPVVASARARALWHERIHGDRRLLRRCREAARDALLHAGHQDLIAKLLPTLLRFMDGDDRPSPGRWTGGVVDLPLRQLAGAGMHGGDRRLV